MAISPPTPATPPPPPTDAEVNSFWLSRTIKELENELKSKYPETVKWVTDEFGKRADLQSMLFDLGLKLIPKLIEAINSAVVKVTPYAGELSAVTINQIMGSHIDPAKVHKDLEGTPGRPALVDLGKEFTQILEIMFPAGVSAAGELDRGNRQFAVDNLDAYFGTNLSFQLRSLAIGTVASLVPGHTLQHLENLHQSINWAYGFGWLSWSVLAAVMGVTTTKPLTEYYNAKIKGNDFTEQQAINAYNQKRITLETLNHILDNHGTRDDTRASKIEMSKKGLTVEQAVKAFVEGKIDAGKFTEIMDREEIREAERPVKVDLARPDLTESDIQDLFNNGLITASDVAGHYTEKGFSDLRKQAKVDLVVDQRMFALQKQLATTYHHGFVIGTVTQGEYEQYLASIHYSALEVQIEVKRAEIEGRGHVNKHLTQAQIVRLVTHGGLSATEGLARMTATGLPDSDARMVLADSILENAVSMIPKKTRDACLDPQAEQNLLSAAITTAIDLDPLLIIRNKDFIAQARCILEKLISGEG